jgi:hypothetical protein
MLNKCKSWCQKWGQLWGFGTIVSYLVGFLLVFEDQMQDPNGYFGLLFIVQFFTLSFLWSYIMKKMSWTLPREVKKTHSW